MPFGWLSAQSTDLNQLVSLEYNKAPLDYVLGDISTVYQVSFSYSADFIPLDAKVSCYVEEERLSLALNELFNTTQIVYALIGNQIVLKIDKDKRVGQVDQQLEEEFTQIIYEEDLIIEEEYIQSRMPEVPAQMELENDMIAGVDLPADFDYTYGKGKIKTAPEPYDYSIPSDFKAKFSVVPQVSAEVGGHKDAPSNTSVNLFWGKTENVEGIEIGGFVNTVTNDVKGVQIAGLLNKVDNDSEGVQAAGLINQTGNDLKGLQFAGLINSVGGDVEGASLKSKTETLQGVGIQIAGLLNVVSGSMEGIQFSGLGNVVGEDAIGLQIGGLFNNTTGDANVQISSIYNKAAHVNDTQIGLVNVCDSIDGTPIGLINIVKGGANAYNRFELSSDMAMQLNGAFKFGTKRLYSQVKLAGHFGETDAWGLGFGMGTAVTMSPRSLLNIEVMAMHINEDGFWTNNLNMLNTINVTFDYRLGKNVSFFAGPNLNFLISERMDSENNIIGSDIAPYTILLDSQSPNALKHKFWIGFSGGFRF